MAITPNGVGNETLGSTVAPMAPSRHPVAVNIGTTYDAVRRVRRDAIAWL